MHPLVDVTSLTDKELDERIQDLSKKYFMPMSGDLKVQVANLIHLYRNELSERRNRVYETQIEKNKDKGLDNLVNIN
jgi:inorganic pyrophosphatase/exopolyphosphatase